MLDPQSQQIALTAKGEAYAVAHRASRRAELESEIERLIEMLDAMDGDPDLEPDGTELDTSWTDRGPQALRGASIDEGDEQDADGEPTLGAPEATLWSAGFYRSVSHGAPVFVHVEPVDSQASWARGLGDDDEQVNEDGGNILDEPHDDYDQDLELDEPTIYNPEGAHLRGGGSDAA